VLKIFRGQRPDITPAQIVSGIPILAELLHSFGIYDLSQPQQDSLAKAATWALALIAGDTVLRVGRAHAQSRVEAAAVTTPRPAAPVSGGHIDAADLPTDDEEFAAPPSDLPVQPSQAFPDDLPSDAEELASPPSGGEDEAPQ
jgi:hypothetical protein